VQFRENYLYTGQARLGFDVNGDASSLITDLNRTIPVKYHFNLVTVAGKSLVYRVVDYLPKTVHEPAGVG
jgi:hypothetical protein